MGVKSTFDRQIRQSLLKFLHSGVCHLRDEDGEFGELGQALKVY